jgi:hypothetical protein
VGDRATARQQTAGCRACRYRNQLNGSTQRQIMRHSDCLDRYLGRRQTAPAQPQTT